jgi:hypothetical protein
MDANEVQERARRAATAFGGLAGTFAVLPRFMADRLEGAPSVLASGFRRYLDSDEGTNPYRTSNPRKNHGQDGHSSSLGHRDNLADSTIRSR